MALTIAIEGTGELTNAESTTNWGVSGSGGISAGQETDIVLQGTYSVSCQSSGNKYAWLYWDEYTAGGSTALDFSSSGAQYEELVYIWWNCTTIGALDTRANAGIAVRMGTDASNYRTWILGGYSSGSQFGNDYTGGWQCAVIDPTKSGSITDTGTYDTSDIRLVGMYIKTLGSAKSDNLIIDTIAVGKGLRITGTDATGWQEISDYCNDFSNRAWGMFQEQGGIYYVYGNVYIGDTTQTVTTSLTDDSRVLRFGDYEYWGSGSSWVTAIPDGFNGITIEDAPSYETTFQDGILVGTDEGRSGSLFIGSEDCNTTFDLYGGGSASSIIKLYGSVLLSIDGDITFGDDSDHQVYSVTFEECGVVEVSNTKFRDCRFVKSETDSILVDASSWDVSEASYSGFYKDVSAEDVTPSGIFFKPDGTKMYIIGLENSTVYQYSLSTAWEVVTATYDTGKYKDVSSEETDPYDVFFKPDGTKMYVVGLQNDTVYQYTLSTAWDVSTATYDTGKYKDVSGQDINPLGVFFRSDGLKMYMVGNNTDSVYQYTLSTAWDVSTATYDTGKYKDVGDEATTPTDLSFNFDGTKMYILGYDNTTVYQYSLSTAWDVSTATYTTGDHKDVGDEDSTPTSVFLDSVRLYIVGNTSDTVYQYSLPTTWDVSDCIFIEPTDHGIVFSALGQNNTFEFDNLVFSGTSFDSLDGYDIENASLYDILIENINESNTGNYENTSLGSTTIVDKVTLSVHVEDPDGNDISDAQVYIQKELPTTHYSDLNNNAGDSYFATFTDVASNTPSEGWIIIWSKSLNKITPYRYERWADNLTAGTNFFLPDEVTGTANTGGSSTTLKRKTGDSFLTGDYQEGDSIRNTTDGSWAVIDEIVDADTITTSQLSGGSDNTWSEDDAFSLHRLAINYVQSDDTVDIPIMNMQTDSNGDVSKDFYYEEDVTVDIRIRIASIAPKYISYYTSGIITDDGLSVTIVLQDDEVA